MKLYNKAKEDVRLKLITILSLTGVVFFNAIATLVSDTNGSSERLSDKFPNVLAPSDSVFIIWILIFLGLWAYVIYQFSTMRGAESTISERTLTRINIYFIINTFLNVLWSFALVFEVLWLTIPLIIGILYTLVRISDFIASDTLALRDNIFVRLPFSLYFGWVTYVTFANVVTWLVSTNWNEFMVRQGTWGVTILIAAFVFAIVMLYKRNDWIYGVAVLWAFVGILINHLSPDGWDGTYPTMIVSLTIVISVLIVVILYVADKEYRLKA